MCLGRDSRSRWKGVYFGKSTYSWPPRFTHQFQEFNGTSIGLGPEHEIEDSLKIKELALNKLKEHYSKKKVCSVNCAYKIRH